MRSVSASAEARTAPVAHAAWPRSAFAGAIAGTIATFAMSPLLSPRLTHRVARALPHLRAPDEFPPRRVVQTGEDVIAGRRLMDDRVEQTLTWVAHVGFGAAMGALYGTLAAAARTRMTDGPLVGAVSGMTFALSVWATSYAGWLPRLGISSGTTRGHPGDVPFPLAAHLVYGATLGSVHEWLSPR